MTRIRMDALTRRFGTVVALHEVSMDVQPGEFFTLLGPSGSGKSTLLRILAGLDAPSDGRLHFDADDVTRVPAWQRGVAMVFQNYALYPHMTVEQNIGYPLKIQRTRWYDITKRVKEVAEALQIDHLLKRKPSQISGGQQQRVALARAVARKPRLFLFDEPLSNLDARMRLEARSFIKKLQRDEGVTAIYVTHDQTEAMALSDRIAVLEGGHLRQVGAPREVYRNPLSPFVGTFVGHLPMNLVSGDVRGADVFVGGIRVADAGDAKGEVQVGVRPEDARWTDHGVPSRVLYWEDLGSEYLLTVDMQGQQVVVRHFGDPPKPNDPGFVLISHATVFAS
ncbi:MAG: ABC transporter ATP-binding protein [Armatimonadetes bacterium]|nr:ABC transporter ATP-binding protein [Armatimonadota bacterium]